MFSHQTNHGSSECTTFLVTIPPDVIWTKKSREYLSYPNPLFQNTAEDARVMSWWDYGYQIAGMANRTTLGKSLQIKIIFISTTKFYTSHWKNKYGFLRVVQLTLVHPLMMIKTVYLQLTITRGIIRTSRWWARPCPVTRARPTRS